MILNKSKIIEKLKKGSIDFEPGLDAYQIQTNSVDLRLGTTFYIPETWKITPGGREAIRADYIDVKENPEYFKMIKLRPGQFFEILPNEFIIISTYEKIKISNDLAAILYPRSSVLRRGIVIEGGTVNAGYEGYLTIPMLNSSSHSIKLYPGERVCHLVFHELSGALGNEELGGVASKYQSSTPFGLDAKLDQQEEIDFIKSGKLEELKTAHRLQKEETSPQP